MSIKVRKILSVFIAFLICFTSFPFQVSEVHAASSIAQIILDDTSLGLSSSKKNTMASMAEVLQNAGYEPAFIAGVLGNVYCEGDCGKFESSNYKSNPSLKPVYLIYMDNNYDYANKYSGQNIVGKSLSEVYSILCELNSKGLLNRDNAGFGLGCVQWSFSRAKGLVEKYIEVASPNDTITLQQVIQAESMYLLQELNNGYHSVYTNWKSTNSGNLNSSTAAYSAGKIVCTEYEKPKDFSYESKWGPRANMASKIYNLINNSSYDPDAPSNIYITGYDGPQEGDVLKVGANCGIYGEIVSAHPLSKVWGGVYNRDGSKVDDYCFYSENTSVRTYSLRKSGGFNDSVVFDYLPEGFYTFKIEATDSKGYSKTVVSKNFQVGNPVVSYTVTLNPNGGIVSPTSIKVSTNGTYSGLANPSKTGYTFAGWYTALTGGTKKENGSSLASNSNHTLYAHWTANKYKVVFNANGGSGSMSDQTLTYDQAANLTANAFKKTGYSFAGWNTKSDGSGTNYSDKASVKNLATSGTVTLYAKWSVGGYTIAYNANGGTGTMTNQSPKYDQTVNLTANAFTRTGYTFAGWNTKADGSGTSYADKASVKNLAASGTVTLYAKWIAVNYNVAFNTNGGTGSMSNQNMKYDQAANLTANTFTRTGYTFAGWNTKADGSGTSYADKASVKNLAASGTITLYAKWTANKYTVKFDGNGADELSKTSMEVTYNSTYGELPQPKRDGYNFIGWYTKAEGGTAITPDAKVTITGTQTLYAQWSQVKFLITFNATGGTSESAQKLVTYDKAYGVLPTAERTGYTFKGWYLDEACTQQITSDTIVTLTANQSVYAKWELRRYVITFDATGGVAERDSKQVTYGKVYGVLPSATKDGDEFIGWFTEDGIEITSASIVEIESDTTLYAKWESDDVIGDVNADGVFNVADVVMMQKWLLCAGGLTDWQAGDLCRDERIDVFDLCLMKRMLIERRGDIQ